jgi:hypothetical protein
MDYTIPITLDAKDLKKETRQTLSHYLDSANCLKKKLIIPIF